MITRLRRSETLFIFFKNFLLTILAFSIPISIQFGYIMPDFQPHLLIMPIVFSLLIASLIGWTGILRMKLERSNQVKNEFISSVSHELRTPLTVINGFSRILSVSSDLPSDKQEYANKIYHSGEYLLDIINDLLDMSRIESGKVQLEIGALLVKDEYQMVLPMLNTQAEEHGINIHIEPYNENLQILADKGRVQQVLTNLISNAIKYGNDNSSIHIQTELKDRMVRTTVVDQGPGISEENLSLLFIPFNRINANQSGVKGTGIGLALSKRLVELMEGQIGASCVVNKGCKFWFELPLNETNINEQSL